MSHCKIADIHTIHRLDLDCTSLFIHVLVKWKKWAISSSFLPAVPKHSIYFGLSSGVVLNIRSEITTAKVTGSEESNREAETRPKGQNISANWLPTHSLRGLQEHGSAAIVGAANWEKNKYLNILRRF